MGVHLNCGVYVEELLSACGPIRRTIKFEKARVSLVKSDNSELIIRIKPSTGSRKCLGYKVSNPKFFTRFVREGKSTISLKAVPVNIMLRNCPPDTLQLFLYNVKGLWNYLKSIKFKRSVFGKDTSLSLLDEVLPIRNGPASEGVSSPKANPFPEPGVSPIHRKRRHSEPAHTGAGVCSSTPIRSSKRKEKLATRVPQFGIDMDKTFSHVLMDWQGENILKNGTLEQARVIEAVKMGLNVFCTGSAGTGKSYLLRKLAGILSPSETAIVASTGLAASLIGGITLHAFSGVGEMLDLEDLEDLSPSWLESVAKRVVSDSRTIARWRDVRRIIIDEVSMITLGKCDEKVPFGGIQIILFGDFFQLPPVLPSSAAYIIKKKFAFQSSVWQACRFRCFELQTSWRQSGDIKFFHLLNEVREGSPSQWVLETLRSRVCRQDNKQNRCTLTTTRLYTHRRDTEKFNEQLLNSLPGTLRVFEKKDTGPKNLINGSFSAIPDTIKLKVGAQVMLLRNLDVSRGLVNGVRGVVESFTPSSEGGFPVVRFFVPPAVASPASEKSIIVQPERWTANFGSGVIGKEVQVTRLQLPLCLAWAISVHRSQGITLDSVEVDLSKVFEHGQAYVALSRCRSLGGLHLLSWQTDFIRVDRRVTKFYHNSREDTFPLVVKREPQGHCSRYLSLWVSHCRFMLRQGGSAGSHFRLADVMRVWAPDLLQLSATLRASHEQKIPLEQSRGEWFNSERSYWLIVGASS
ncbi:ATP-dependent DNA helicase PIF1 [Taenia crassiceps]|uniref:ATP-dependent DNA helicase n=1 Tax=Taenia crassiceps TaxID=6207 RepID=A0ABR4QRZ1_9CEST